MNYIGWSTRQLYLLAFQPSVFRREIEGEASNEPKLSYVQRFKYQAKLFPWILILVCFANLLAGLIYQGFGQSYSWLPSYAGLVLGMVSGAVFGSSLRASAAVAGSFAGGVALGVVGGVAVGTLINVWIYLTIGIFAGPIIGSLLGLLLRRGRAREKGPAPVSLLSACAGLALGIGVFVPIATGQVAIGIPNGLAVSLGAAVAGGIVTGIASPAVFGLYDRGLFGLSLGFSVGLGGALAFGISGTIIFGLSLGVAVSFAFLIAYPLVHWTFFFRLVNYPINSLIALVSYYAARRSPHAIVRAWRFFPVVWDEVIWLPLPYLRKFLLLLLKYHREYGLKQLVFVSTHRALQRNAVLNSVSELVLDDLKASTVLGVAASSERLSWTTDQSVNLESSLASALSLFDRIAQHAKQYLSVHNDYRKHRVLEQAATEVDALRKTLLTNPATIAPRLLYITEQWSSIISQEQAALATRGELSRGLPNPFITGEPVREDFKYAFTGRHEIVWKIEESMLGRKHTPTLLLYGPRRMGKTSILTQLPRLLGPGFAPIFVDCQNPHVSSATGSVGTWLRYLSVKISEGLQRRHVTVEPLAAGDLAQEPFAVFDQWLDSVQGRLPPGMRVLLCLDEYESLQRILKTAWGDEFLDGLRHLIQHRPAVAVMFCGAHTFAESGPAWTSRFINAKLMRVSFLSYEDVLPLLTKPVPEFDLKYEPGVLEALYEATRGQPYLTQLVAYELVEYLNEQQRKQAGLADLQVAISRALENGSEYFSNIWFDAGDKGQAILRAIAMSEPPPEHASARQRLEKQEVLKENGTFAVPMVERWFKERLPQAA